MLGKKTTSEHIRAAKGTLQKCRTNKNALSVNGNILLSRLPKAPREFSAKWKRFYLMIAQELLTLNLLSVQNTFIVHRYTKYAKAWQECSEKIDASDYIDMMTTVQGSHVPMISQYLNVMLKVEKEMRSIESEFGFTPAARSRIIGNVAKVNVEEEDFEKL